MEVKLREKFKMIVQGTFAIKNVSESPECHTRQRRHARLAAQQDGSVGVLLLKKHKAISIPDITAILAVITAILFFASFFANNNNNESIANKYVANNGNNVGMQNQQAVSQFENSQNSNNLQQPMTSNSADNMMLPPPAAGVLPSPDVLSRGTNQNQQQNFLPQQMNTLPAQNQYFQPMSAKNFQTLQQPTKNIPANLPLQNNTPQAVSQSVVVNTQNSGSQQVILSSDTSDDAFGNLKAKNIPYQTYDFKYLSRTTVSGNLEKATVSFAVPQSETYQIVTASTIGKSPTDVVEESGKKSVKINLKSIKDTKLIYGYQGQVKTITYDLRTAKKLNNNKTPETDLSRYLSPEKYIESDSAYIIAVAKSIRGATREEIVQNIYTYVKKNISYKELNKNIGAKKALQYHNGKCTEIAGAMIALCRARGIPARSVVGYCLDQSETKIYHAWVEVYYDEYGWVTYDPTYTMYNKNGSKIYNSSVLMGNYLILWRNDLTFPTTLNYSYSTISSNVSYSPVATAPYVKTHVSFTSKLVQKK